MKLTENFSKHEFECSDGSEMSDRVLENIKELAKNLQIIRDLVCAPITINSAYRSPIYNKQINGASKSLHLVGKAADITIEGMTPKEVQNLLLELMEEGTIAQGGLGKYQSFTHYDFRGKKARW